jgi:protein-tyrosine phosphatase
MAQGLVRHLLGSECVVESAGMEAAEGLPAMKDAISVMREHGIDISSHQSRGIEELDLASFDVVVAMTPFIAWRLREMGVDCDRIAQLDVADPYGKGIEVYRLTAQEIQCQIARLFAADKIGDSEK